jgi:ribonuclease P protein component
MFPYTSALGQRLAGRRFREGSEDGQGKAHVSAEHSPPGEDAWLPPADADARRAGDTRRAAPQGPEPPQRFRLIRSVRTPGIRKVFRDGQPVHGKRMVLFAAPGSGGFALVAGKKVGGAVERNRARRVLRAALREVAPRGMEGHDIVLVAREAIRGARTQDLIAEMTELLGRAGMRP